MGKDILKQLLYGNYITIVLIVAFSIKLINQRKARDAETRYFWITIISCALLILEDIAESIAASDSAYYYFRVSFSVIGYILRPMAAVGLLLVVCPPERRTWRIWILCIVNAAINLTAFFSPLAFSYGEDYGFVRGPLGYAVFVIAFVYMFQILALIWRRFYERNAAERWILITCAASCIFASVVDAQYGGSHLNDAIMVSSVFFYIFLRSHDNRIDQLTELENRFAFFEDVEREQKGITAVASLDMNGLKTINDTHGHTEGDRALAAIGRCLRRVNSRNTIAYRIGGDEFVILFLQQDSEAVERTLEQVREDVAKAGYSVAAGYEMKPENESVEEVLLRSDRKMYGEKDAYYQRSGLPRR